MRIREGDPLEIYTDHEGEVIFKKYSPIGELTNFAAQYAETLHKTCDLSVAICDRDCVIACAGVPRKDFLDKRLSADLERILEGRSLYHHRSQDKRLAVTDDDKTSEHVLSCVMPILAEGDIIGGVMTVKSATGADKEAGDTEIKLVQTAASFLGKHIEA